MMKKLKIYTIKSLKAYKITNTYKKDGKRWKQIFIQTL